MFFLVCSILNSRSSARSVSFSFKALSLLAMSLDSFCFKMSLFIVLCSFDDDDCCCDCAQYCECHECWFDDMNRHKNACCHVLLLCCLYLYGIKVLLVLSRVLYNIFDYMLKYILRTLRNDCISKCFQSSHSIGNPIIHTTNWGDRRAFFPILAFVLPVSLATSTFRQSCLFH